MFTRILRESVPLPLLAVTLRRGICAASVEATGAIALAREALARGVPVRLRVFGASMTPTLASGTAIEIHPVLGAPPRSGEVIAWVRGERLVVPLHWRASASFS